MIDFLLYTALLAFAAGLAYQFFKFFKAGIRINPDSAGIPGIDFKVFLKNTMFQARLFRAGKVRWAAHLLLFTGFLYLLLIHGLHAVTADLFFSDYQPTLDPFQLLRNLAGGMVLFGCLIFLWRRRLKLRVNTDKKIRDKGVYAIVLIIVVILSGFALEASKIISEPVFMEMIEEYSDIEDEQDLLDLKLYWKDNYSVYFNELPKEGSLDIENGRELNEEYCLYCHSPVKSAVISRKMARSISVAGFVLNAVRMDRVLFWLHYILCLTLLVCLPFSRLFHVLLIPFSTARKPFTQKADSKKRVSINMASLYACTNCGYCSQVCSVYPNFQVLGNANLMPHAKIESVKALMEKRDSVDVHQLFGGNQACTHCNRCTNICPSGIDLQSLWTVLDDKLGRMGVAGSSDLIHETPINEWNNAEFTFDPVIPAFTSNLADRTEAFENCIQCTICTNVCPVVDYDSHENDMTPHQIMNLLRLDKKHLATGTRMVWSCLTCYSCQENCPEGIRVTDILLELRNTGSLSADAITKKQTLTRQAD